MCIKHFNNKRNTLKNLQITININKNTCLKKATTISINISDSLCVWFTFISNITHDTFLS